VYPDYRYPPWGQKRKGATSGKVVASAAPSEPASKSKKLKVLTHRPRYIEPAVVPEFGGKTSSAVAPKEPIPSMQKAEEPATMPKAPSAEQVEAKTGKDKAEEPKTKGTKMLKVLSPSVEVTVPGLSKLCLTLSTWSILTMLSLVTKHSMLSKQFFIQHIFA
jgi:hypothetical protein